MMKNMNSEKKKKSLCDRTFWKKFLFFKKLNLKEQRKFIRKYDINVDQN